MQKNKLGKLLSLVIMLGCIFIGISGLHGATWQLGMGWSLQEREWVTTHKGQTINVYHSTKGETKEYIEKLFLEVEKLLDMSIKLVDQKEPIMNNQFVIEIKSEYMNEDGFVIPYTKTESGEVLKIIANKDNQQTVDIIYAVIGCINRSIGLDNLWHETRTEVRKAKLQSIVAETFEQGKEIVIGYDPELYPLTYRHYGKARGVAIEELNTLFSLINIEPVYVPLNEVNDVDAIALVGQTYEINKSDVYFLLDPILVGNKIEETVYINRFFPQFKNLANKFSYNIVFVESLVSENARLQVEDRRVFEGRSEPLKKIATTVLSDDKNKEYGACIGNVKLTKKEMEVINQAIEVWDNHDETRYRSVNRVNPMFIFFIACALFLVICMAIIILYFANYETYQKKYVRQIASLTKQNNELKSLTLSISSVFEGVDDKWDNDEVNEHGKRVGLLTECLVSEMDVSEEFRHDVFLAAIFHDMGKVGVDTAILLKQKVLNHQEFIAFQKHTSIGKEIAERLKLSKIVKNVVEYHHEQWDGSGYYGLRKNEIPLEAQIVNLLDNYDTIRTERIYHPSYTHQEAIAVIVGERGGEFNPELVDLLVKKQSEIEQIYMNSLSM